MHLFFVFFGYVLVFSDHFIDVPCELDVRFCYTNAPFPGNDTPPFDEGIDYAQSLLQKAIEIEHSTMPLYLSAMYSINDSNSTWTSDTIHGVVIEEMLHMTIAANVLNAIGGSPVIDSPNFVPEFPMDLPFLNVTANLEPFSKRTVDVFKLIESETSDGRSVARAYQFVIDLLTSLSNKYGESRVFSGDWELQLEVQFGSESVGKIANLSQVSDAILKLADQGTGEPMHGHESEWPNVTDIHAGKMGGGLSHRARFMQMHAERLFQSNDTFKTGPTGKPMPINWNAVHQFSPNPKIADFAKFPNVYALVHDFAKQYTQVLMLLHDVFNGHIDGYWGAVGAMHTLADKATAILKTPDPRNASFSVGLTWEYVSSHPNSAANIISYANEELSQFGVK